MATLPRVTHQRLRLPSIVAVTVFLGILVTGCGTEPAAQAGSVSANLPVGTNSQVASAYATVVGFALNSTLTQGYSLLSQMNSSDRYSLGVVCSNVGLQYSYQYDTFRHTNVPARARSAANQAIVGYKLALSAMDECGNASDTNDARSMRTAAYDLWRALRQISHSEHSMSTWASAAH